jgi:uncharacterized protein (DUF4415 family)
MLDARFDYDESRMCGLVPLGSVLYCVAFVDRADVEGPSAYEKQPARRYAPMSKIPKRPVIEMPTREEDLVLIAVAKADPDAQPLTSEQLRKMVPLSAVKGRPRSASAKQLVSVRYSPEVIAYFKNTGEGWQTRMDDVLKEYVVKNSKA